MKLFRRGNRPATSTVASAPSQPIETGTVAWLRSLDEALAQSQATGAPIFVLFQEVPGCAGCQQFGADVLSDPRIVDAIETSFVPLLIHNNTPGPDAEVLAMFNEPAWNFQVVRFLDSSRNDLIERRDRVWETGPLAARMIQALTVAGRPTPAFLRLTEQEHSERPATAFLAQPCFWVGEMELGQIAGVVTTEAGFLQGHEVTRVDYDPIEVSAEALVTAAKDRAVATNVFIDAPGSTTFADGYRVAPASDQKRQLGDRSRAGFSPAQLTKLNAFIADPEAALQYLAPSQRQ